MGRIKVLLGVFCYCCRWIAVLARGARGADGTVCVSSDWIKL